MSRSALSPSQRPVLALASKTGRVWDRGLRVTADRAERVVASARRVADQLDEIGMGGQAEDVRRVCRSNSSYRVTCRELYLDNVELRKRLGEL